MSALSEKLAKKKFAHRDITLCLDGTLSLKRDEAMEELAKLARSTENGKSAPDARLSADPVLTATKLVESIEDEMRANSITLRITAVSFGEYNKFIIQNKPRKDSEADRSFGFNTQEFFLFVARRTGTYIDEAGNENAIDKAEWDAIEESLTDGDHDRIAGAILDINRREGQRGVDFLSRDSATTPDSDETSESPETSE
jgi:hypothetical protein